jgi:hypothetical protein
MKIIYTVRLDCHPAHVSRRDFLANVFAGRDPWIAGGLLRIGAARNAINLDGGIRIYE